MFITFGFSKLISIDLSFLLRQIQEQYREHYVHLNIDLRYYSKHTLAELSYE